VAVGDESKVLLKCHAECPVEAIVAAINLDMADLFDGDARSNGSRPEIVSTYPYCDEDGALLYEVVRYWPKAFKQRRPDGAGGWIWKLGDTRRVLYRLPQVRAAAEAGKTVLVVEGEKDVHAAEKHGKVATCNAGGAGKWRSQYSEALRGARVAIVADADTPGRDHARAVARTLDGIAAAVKLLEPAEPHGDISDHLRAGRKLAELVEFGTRASTEDEPETAPEPSVSTPTVPVPDLAELLDGIATTIRKFVVMSDAQRDLAALWVPHSHAIAAADSTAYLEVSSPEKESGKSRLLECFAQLVPRPLEAANVSDAALFRSLGGDGLPATLLFDEVDAIFGPKARDREDLRSLINAGWRRGAMAHRCVGEGSRQEVVAFPVFGAKALAGIGELPETVASRCIPIRLRRRAPDEPVARGRYRDIAAACKPLREAAAAWAAANAERLRTADPELPDALSDRAQDGAEPLLAIADAAGGDWPSRARKALVKLHADRTEDGESWGVQVLADIKTGFGDRGQIRTADLLACLKADDEAPWGSWGRGDGGLDPRGLANLLRPYGIRSADVHVEDDEGRKTLKGYARADFEDAWDRYLPPDPGSIRAKRANGSTEPKTEGSYPRQKGELARIEIGRKPHGKADGADGADGRRKRGNTACPSHPESPAPGCRYCAAKWPESGRGGE